MTKRIWGTVTAAALAVLLAGCLVLPGKFGSDLSLRRDGTFSYAYKGEIYLLALAEPDKPAAKDDAKFEPSPCYDEETIEEKACTADELAAQKAEWDDARKAAADKKKQDAEMMKAMMGGIDPSDPKAGEMFAERLARQAGWNSVVYKGKGVFEVDYAITGRLDHDFAFPTIEKMGSVAPFVTIVRRNDGTVRVEAPGFASNGAGNPMLAFMQAMGSSMGGTGPAKSDNDKLPKAEGTFTVVTDGEVLANDTDEGPKADPMGKRLTWNVGALTTAAPTALIKLAN
jgi:hypothetical protein